MAKEQFRVIVLERDPHEALVILTVLQQTSYDVLCAEDRMQTLVLLREKNGFTNGELPNLILLDMTSTQEDLYDLLNEIKQDKNLAHIPIIAICNGNRSGQTHQN